MGLGTSRSPVERYNMTAAERAEKIVQELKEHFLIGGQKEKYIRNRIIEEIEKAEQAVQEGKSKKTRY